MVGVCAEDETPPRSTHARTTDADASSPYLTPLFPRTLVSVQNENVQLRLNSIRRLTTIATALGAERTRSELIPFLTDSNDDEDECLLAIAEEMGNLIPKVGGPEHVHCLLAPLENLSTVEETVVREKAVDAACKVGKSMNEEGIAEHYVPMVQVREKKRGDFCVFVLTVVAWETERMNTHAPPPPPPRGFLRGVTLMAGGWRRRTRH